MARGPHWRASATRQSTAVGSCGRAPSRAAARASVSSSPLPAITAMPASVQRVGKVAEREPADERRPHELHVRERRQRRRRRALEREDEQEVAERARAAPTAAISATSVQGIVDADAEPRQQRASSSACRRAPDRTASRADPRRRACASGSGTSRRTRPSPAPAAPRPGTSTAPGRTISSIPAKPASDERDRAAASSARRATTTASRITRIGVV